MLGQGQSILQLLKNIARIKWLKKCVLKNIGYCIGTEVKDSQFYLAYGRLPDGQLQGHSRYAEVMDTRHRDPESVRVQKGTAEEYKRLAEALDGEFFNDAGGPLAKLHGSFGINFIAHRYNGSQIVVFGVVYFDVAGSYSKFSNNL